MSNIALKSYQTHLRKHGEHPSSRTAADLNVFPPAPMLYSIMIILNYSLQLCVGSDNLQNTPNGSFNWRCGESGTYD